MSSFAQRWAADRRRIILQTLSESPGYACNIYLLQQVLTGHGHSVAADTLQVELATLSEWGLISTESVATITVATITQRGLDVAADRATVPGVARRQPGA